MSAGSLALYTHLLGVVEGSGLLYVVYRKHRALVRTPALVPMAVGLLVFVSVEAFLDFLPPLVVHLLHAVAAGTLAVGLAGLVTVWSTTRAATDPVSRGGDRPDELTEMDDDILALLDSADAVLSPALVSYNLGYSRESVNRHLRTLESHDLVERVDRGKYRLSVAARRDPYWPMPGVSSVGTRLRRLVRRAVSSALRGLAALRRAGQRSGR